jgi:predicted amidohydrolase
MGIEIACVGSALESQNLSAHIFLLPERTQADEITKMQAMHPQAIIVGAVQEENPNRGRLPLCRGALLHDSTNRIDYLKVGSDGQSLGTNVEPLRFPIYETADICIAVIICMDIQVHYGAFRAKVVRRVQESAAVFKIVCVPAAMNGDWFGDATGIPCPQEFAGVYIALSNSDYYEVRCKSFVADPSGRYIAKQKGHEAIRATVLP